MDGGPYIDSTPAPCRAACFAVRAALLLILALVASAPAAPGPVGCTKIRDTGDDANRLIVVILGDGYTEDDLEAGSFAGHVEAFLKDLSAEPPWDVMLPVANVYRIDIASNESGADYEDNSPANGGTLKDTYLNAQFWGLGSEDLLVLDYDGRSRAQAAADDCVGVAAWDLLAVVVNSAKYGGSGGQILVGSAHPLSADILEHEAAHTFAPLGDEYNYTTNRYRGGDPIKWNLDTNGVSPKWSVWVEPGTPLPTPDTPDYAGVVGAFEGASNFKYGIYRPSRNCKMRTLSASFCPICREAHLVRLFDHVPLVEGAVPAASSFIAMNGPTNIVLDLPPLKDLAITWSSGGRALTGETNATLVLDTGDVASPTATVAATVAFASPAVRSTSILTTLTWTVANLAVTPCGVPHWWLAQHGIDPETEGDQYDEGDGVPAWEEYAAGTDPTNAASLLIASGISTPEESSVVVQWQSAEGRTYSIRGAADLLDPSSGRLLEGGIPATPPLNSHTVGVAGAGAFFLSIAPE
jgi:hypothetical protein